MLCLCLLFSCLVIGVSNFVYVFWLRLPLLLIPCVRMWFVCCLLRVVVFWLLSCLCCVFVSVFDNAVISLIVLCLD